MIPKVHRNSDFFPSFKTRDKMSLKCSNPELISAVHNTRSFCMFDLMFEAKFQICDLTAARHKVQSSKNVRIHVKREINPARRPCVVTC